MIAFIVQYPKIRYSCLLNPGYLVQDMYSF